MKRKNWIIILIAMLVVGAAVYFVAGKKTQQAATSVMQGVPQDPLSELEYINLGDYGCKWETYESGETMLVFPDGAYARSYWVKDGNKYYYVDVSGCQMKGNYSHDGYYVGRNGVMDKTVVRITKDVRPQEGKKYTDDSGICWTFYVSSKEAHLTYPEGYNYKADYEVVPLGHSAYALYNIEDEYDCWHAVVLENGKAVRLSTAGVTEEYRIQ